MVTFAMCFLPCQKMFLNKNSSYYAIIHLNDYTYYLNIGAKKLMSLAIVTDSTSYLDETYIQENNITVLPLMVTFSDGSYREMADIDLRTFYDKMEKLDEIPSSSQPSYGQIVKTLKNLAQDHDRILALTISSGISGTYNSFAMAAEEIDEAEVTVIDSQLTCRYLANYIDLAIQMDRKGHTIEEITERIEQAKASTEVILSVNNLTNFKKSGRISNAAAFLGDMLQIRPILEFQEGEIVATDKVRTNKRVIRYILDKFDQAYQASSAPLKIVLLESFQGQNEQIQLLKEELAENYPEVIVEEGIVGPVIGTHTGPTVYSLGWMIDFEKEGI